MEFEKSSFCRVMAFHFCIEVGNLVRAGRAWEKTGQKPIIDPPLKKTYISRNYFTRTGV